MIKLNAKLKSFMSFISKVFLIFLLLFNTSKAADQIGVIGFVIGEVINQNGNFLKVGDSVYFGDTIIAKKDAKSQLLFIDQTVMTIGSKTELTIDEFVYDPKNNDGKLLTTIKSGSVKVLTGKISEKNPANLEVTTPAGTIGTRGTEFKASVDPVTTESKILLVGPGPKNSLNLRAGEVEVSNAAGTVTLNEPYLFTELTQNKAPTAPIVIPQVELQKFQELEIQPDQPVTDQQGDTNENQLASSDDLSEEEIGDIVKAEIFLEGEDKADLVIDTLVNALSKDDGGITAQMIGKSFLRSGQRNININLPEGIDLNSPEANKFFDQQEKEELEKVLLVSARVKDIEYVPTKLNEFGGFEDIRVPIKNDQTGTVVLLEMGNIDFKPQIIPAGFNNTNQEFLPRVPEELFLKGGNENVFIDFNEGQFIETSNNPELDTLDQRYKTALQTGATQDEIEQIFDEMDQALQIAENNFVTIDMAKMENVLLPNIGVKMNFFSQEEFTREQDNFLISPAQYKESWDETEIGQVAIFQIDGSVKYVNDEQSDAAWQQIDQQYEQRFEEAFPEIYQAEKKAEQLIIQANQQANTLYSKVDQLIQSGTSKEKINSAYDEVLIELDKVYSQVDQAFEGVFVAEAKTNVLIAAEEAQNFITQVVIAKETGQINGREISKEELAVIEKEAEFLEVRVEEAKQEYIKEVQYVKADNPKIKLETPEIKIEKEVYEVRKSYEPSYVEPKYEVRYERNEKNAFAAGQTTYADLNEASSGINTYTGSTTNLVIETAGSSANSDVDAAGEIAGSFNATHSINYSTRTITQGADITVNKFGQNTTSRTFSVEKGHTFSATDKGYTTPNASFNVAGDDQSNSVSEVASDITDTVSSAVTDGATYQEQGKAANTHYLVTVSADIQNTGSFADTVQTTVTIESEQSSDGSQINKASGTDSPTARN